MTYEDICKANANLSTMDIKGKDYVLVNERIKAFRMLYPEGFILTEIVSNEGGVCVMRARVGFIENGTHIVLGTGTAYEREEASYINRTSYIENCETSAVGRALGMLALGIDTSVASAEEVQNAVSNQQEAPKRPSNLALKEIQALAEKAGVAIEAILQQAKVERLEDISPKCAADIKKALQAKITRKAREAQNESTRETA